MTGPDWRTSNLGGLEFSIPGFLGVGKFGKKCTLRLNLPEYRVTGVSPLVEWGREKRKEWQQGAFSPFFFPPFIPILPTICCETVVMETRERGEGTEATVCLPFVVFSFQPRSPAPIPWNPFRALNQRLLAELCTIEQRTLTGSGLFAKLSSGFALICGQVFSKTAKTRKALGICQRQFRLQTCVTRIRFSSYQPEAVMHMFLQRLQQVLSLSLAILCSVNFI